MARGGDSQIKAEIILLEEALKSNSDYYHLISGFDLPLHDMDYIDDFFIKHKGKEFIHFSELDETMTPRTRQRISIYHPFQNMLGGDANGLKGFSIELSQLSESIV